MAYPTIKSALYHLSREAIDDRALQKAYVRSCIEESISDYSPDVEDAWFVSLDEYIIDTLSGRMNASRHFIIM